MPTIIQPGYASERGPWDNVGNAITQGTLQGFELGYQNLQKQRANKFAVVSDIIAKTFPDERGGFTSAYRSGNPQAAAAADQALGLYLNSVEGITGKRMSPQEREAIKGAFVNGQLTTSQLIADARALSVEGLGAVTPSEIAPQESAQPAGVNGVVVSGPATPQAATSPLGGARNIETLSPLGISDRARADATQVAAQQEQQRVAAEQQALAAQTSTAPGAYAGVTLQTTPASSLSANPYMEKGFTPVSGGIQGTYQPASYTKDQQEANRQKVLEILSFGLYKSDKTKAAQRDAAMDAARNQQGRSYLREEAKRNKSPFRVGENSVASEFVSSFDVTPEQGREVANQVSRELPQGEGRAIPTGTGSEIALSNAELSSVAKAAKAPATMMDTLLKARNADELGTRLYSVSKALDTAATLIPGAKELNREWATNVVKYITQATPQELSALGLNEEAKVVLENDRTRVMAEQNVVSLRNALLNAGVEITRFDREWQRAKIEYLGKVAAATGTKEGLMTSSLAAVINKAMDTVKDSFGGKSYTAKAFRERAAEMGWNSLMDFVAGTTNPEAEGSIFQPATGLGGWFGVGTPGKFRPPTEEEQVLSAKGLPLGTPGAVAGKTAAGYLGGEGESDQNAASYMMALDQAFGNPNMMGELQRNVNALYDLWRGSIGE